MTDTIQEKAAQMEVAYWKHYIRIGIKDYFRDFKCKKGGILYYVRNAKAIYERKRISYEFVQAIKEQKCKKQ